MASSETEICNIALSNLGQSKTIASLTEQSEEARACSLLYPVARDAVLRDFKNGFSKKTAVLNLVEEDPSTEWGFSYRVPSDCLFVRRIVSGIRNETEDTKISFDIAADDQGSLILTDQEDAEIEYTYRVTQVSRFPADFVMALAFRLAAYMAPRLTGSDQFKIQQRMMQAYQIEIARSHQNAANESQWDVFPDSEFERSRY